MNDFKPIPELLQFIVCEDATIEVSQQNGEYGFDRWTIRKPLGHVYMPKGVNKGFGTPELIFYYQITSGCGLYPLIIEIHELDLAQPKKSRKLAWSDLIHVKLKNELSLIEDIVVLKNVPFPNPGQYMCTMRYAGEPIPGGTIYLRVFPGEPK